MCLCWGTRLQGHLYITSVSLSQPFYSALWHFTTSVHFTVSEESFEFYHKLLPPSGRTCRLRSISCNVQCHVLFSCPFHDTDTNTNTNAVTSAALIKTFLIMDVSQISHSGASIRPTLLAVFRSKLHSTNADSLPPYALTIPQPVHNAPYVL
jgi:hypothetical protein